MVHYMNQKKKKKEIVTFKHFVLLPSGPKIKT